MLGVGLLVGGLLLAGLHRSAMETQREHLLHLVRTQARLIESVARFDERFSASDVEGGALAATISQVSDAYQTSEAIGETGEFVLAQREGDSIVFLTDYQAPALEQTRTLPFDAARAEPMQRALMGDSGTLVGADYEGTRVLAAHEPLSVAGEPLGLVAKMDLTEIRAPFFRTVRRTAVVGLLVLLAASALFYFLGDPLFQKLEENAELRAEVRRRRRAEEKLRKHRRHLKELVAERTRELEELNQGLQAEIDRRKEAEADLRTSEARFRRLAENAPDMIYRMSLPDGHYEYVSPAAEKIWGVPPEEFYENPLLVAETLHPASEDYFRTEWANLLAGDMPPTYEYRIIDRRGRERWLHQRNVLIRNEDGTPRAIEGIVTDITERVRAMERFQALFRFSADLVCVADADGYFRELNPAWERVLGYSRKELLDRPFLDLVHPDDREPTREVVEDQLESGEAVLRFRNRYITKGGDVVWLSWTSQPDVKEGQVFAIARDVTEETESEDRVRALVEELERSNRDLQQFAYVASHDLQEPLRMVASFTQLLADRYRDELDSDARDFIDFAVDGANRMQKLIQGLLAYSRVQTRGEELEPTDAGEVLEGVLRDLGPLLEESGGQVIHEPLPMVKADGTQLARVFQNLIENGLKFAENGSPEIRVEAEARDDEWVFTVRDDGPGIPAEYAERIFVIFQRLQGRDGKGGQGIGLSICKRIVERHGGRIWLDPNEGPGATFRFTLPMTPKEV
jgi:PAS domain S-box-containing protein